MTGSVAVTVADDEGAASFSVTPSFSVAGARVAEGDTGTADLEFTVTLSPAGGRGGDGGLGDEQGVGGHGHAGHGLRGGHAAR